jgi:hypothetical protein
MNANLETKIYVHLKDYKKHYYVLVGIFETLLECIIHRSLELLEAFEKLELTLMIS